MTQKVKQHKYLFEIKKKVGYCYPHLNSQRKKNSIYTTTDISFNNLYSSITDFFNS
jgi:spore coat protein CotF